MPEGIVSQKSAWTKSFFKIKSLNLINKRILIFFLCKFSVIKLSGFFATFPKTKKYQMAIRHRNKYRITMESNPPLPNLYSFTPLVFKTSYTFGKLNFYIPLVVQFLGNGWIRTKKIIFVYSATVHVLYNYFII